MNLRCVALLLLLIGAFAACRPPEPVEPVAPKPSRTAVEAVPIPWAKRDSRELPVPATVKHLQLVITSAYHDKDSFAWLISNGTEVHALYHAESASELGELLGELTRRYTAGGQKIQDKGSLIMMGSIRIPPPPPPPVPGGMPIDIVNLVTRVAWQMNHRAVIETQVVEQVQLKQQVGL